MEWGPISGQTDEYSQVSMTMIKSTVTASIHGLTIESTEDGGRRENRMALASMLFMRR